MALGVGARAARRFGDFSILLRSGSSAVALCAMAGTVPALAQSVPNGDLQAQDLETSAGDVQNSSDIDRPDVISNTTEIDEASAENAIVVTGIRQSLANAQAIKRNADTFVDAITSQDIGALPDRSVTEALQRVPGVSISRFAGSNDPDHFSAEGSGVVVRGLSFVRSEFNGRDSFSTGVYGQAINFADVPADLLGSVEVYKNSTAELIEGGLSGTVNMNLRLPFDHRGLLVGVNLEANYSDLSEEWSPVGSLLVSDNWDTGIGRIGLLGAVSYSQLLSRSDGIQVTNFQRRDNTAVEGANDGGTVCRTPLPSDSDTTTLPDAGANCGVFGSGGPDGFADLLTSAYAPLGGQFRTQDYNRERLGIAASAQWESLDRRSLLTLSFLRSQATQKWGEHTFEAGPDLSEYNTFPAGCVQNAADQFGNTRAQCPVGGFQNYQYDEDGVFESGFITLPGEGWRSADTGEATTRVPTGGIQHSLSRRMVDDENIVSDYGANFKFTPSDRLALNFDVQYVRAEHNNRDFGVFGSIFADQEVDLSGDVPVVIPHKPLTLRDESWGAPNPALEGASDAEYFADPMFTFWRNAMDHIEESDGEEWAFRGDLAYTFEEGGFFTRAKFGARYADRDQNIRFSAYNWGSLSEVWSGQAVYMDQVGTDQVEQYSWDNFFRGDTVTPPTANYYSGNLIGGYEQTAELLKQIQEAARATGASGTTSWLPVAEREGVVPGTVYLPDELQTVSETNEAAYAMLSFDDEGLFLGPRIEGNIGVRLVSTQVKSAGSIGVPSQQQLGLAINDPNDPNNGQALPYEERCQASVPENAPPGTPPQLPGGVCTIGAAAYAELQQFATGLTVANIARNEYTYFLPSLNLKIGLTDELILRLAGSRNLARPGMGDIRNYLTVGSDTSTGFRLAASAGNPFLKPAISDNFDASLEWYFATVGSLTFNAFYKNIHNFFYQEITFRDITSNNITQQVQVRGPANFDGTGKVKGFELAYQQTYDFLPGPLSGLGVSANYSFIDSEGLPNSLLALGEAVDEPVGGVPGNLPLEQLSKHNVNVAAFYEKGPISLRAAYNWRSRFLLTAADVIFPYYPIFNEATGQLDASVFLNVNENIKVGVQGVNLTNEVTKTLQQFSSDGLLGPRSYFMNDRRFAFIVRGTF